MRLTDDQLACYQEDGVLVLPGLFSAEEVDTLRLPLAHLFAEDVPQNFREKESGEVRTAMGLHLRDEVYWKATHHPRLVEPAWQILGDDRLYVQQTKVNAKIAFTGEVWQWHYDFATHHNEDGVPEPLALNLHILLDEVSEFNGPRSGSSAAPTSTEPCLPRSIGRQPAIRSGASSAMWSHG